MVRICRSWEEGCAAAGLPVRDDGKRGSTAAARREVIEAYQTGRIGCDEFAQRISDILDGTYSPKEIMQVHRAWILGEYEGVKEVVGRIHESGLETAMLSNTNHSHWMQMEEPGRFPAFKSVRQRHASHLLGLHKPDPAIYRALGERVGATPAEILFFDDLSENVDAARRCGWRAVQIDPFGDTAQQIINALEHEQMLTATV